MGIGLSDNVVSDGTETSNVCIFIQTFDVFRSMLEEATNNGMVSDSSVGIGLFG